ncbi:MAG: hypothetical protein M1388_00390 [Thaumarchaeota archaeon]|nr:hypothetical protein [Nitrososphaerota archaeon]
MQNRKSSPLNIVLTRQTPAAPCKADEAAKICAYYAPPTVPEAWTK